MSISISEHSITEFVRWADYLGTFAFAISGTRLAAAHRFDWFGAFVIGLVTAVGGGTIRDVMLDLPVFWMIEPSYILIATLALFVTIVLRHWLVRINNTVFIFDAIGLGLFTAVGVAKSLHAGLPWWIAPVMGTVTGSFGGILRDILINEVPLIFRNDFYAMACVIGSFVYLGILYLG
ncbi:MAG: trimeric intracellular cation channel family protein, partial [Porphyromonas endodontalis]